MRRAKTVRDRAGQKLDFAHAKEKMDLDILEALESIMPGCSSQEFFDSYALAHRTKHGKEWPLAGEMSG
jgi:hypothetical protein